MTQSTSDNQQPLFGVIAEYDTPTAIYNASKKVRDAGYNRWDTYTPFPIHGIEKAMGIRMTKLPWIVICATLTGLTTAILLQWWTNAVDYKWLISGKPFWSWPANVPIMFELSVLFSAFATIFGMLVLNNLPLFSHPLDLKERFRRVSDDKFFLVIEASDPKFDHGATTELLNATTPVVLEEVRDERTSSTAVPKPLVYILLLGLFGSLVPFALFAKARSSTMREGRIHVVWDMDFSPSYKPQSDNIHYSDERGMRSPVTGTVARGHLNADEHLHLGKQENGTYALTLPSTVAANDDIMKRGKVQFETYCSPCHGTAGDGNGIVHKRAEALGGAWVPPANLLSDHVRSQEAGKLFNTITNGYNSMKGYASQIEAEDRWAIILYLRALQNSQGIAASELPEAERAQLK
ncbi:MAG: DUF3341 domain-containing protein [Polyangiaceae bacterium]|nr:DUF3341 domain-containing protein [Polyangiaceae bacterium]